MIAISITTAIAPVYAKGLPNSQDKKVVVQVENDGDCVTDSQCEGIPDEDGADKKVDSDEAEEGDKSKGQEKVPKHLQKIS